MEAIAEHAIEQAQDSLNDALPKAKPTKGQGTRLFCGSYAREMAQKSRIVRGQRKLEAEQAKEIVAQLKAEPSQVYRLKRLELVRSQLAKADSELTELLDDPKADQSRLKAILDAVKVLSEQERKLDNRADPGSYRPRTPSTKQPSTGFAPIEE